MVLYWDKPAKKMSTSAWKEDYGFDGGPNGGYQSNMSDDDAARWKAKITGTKLGFPQVEIRKTLGSCQALVIVNLGKGYNYKHYRAESEHYHGKTPTDFNYPMTQAEIDEYAERDSTAGINVHMSLNGPAQLTFAEMAELQLAVAEAKIALETL